MADEELQELDRRCRGSGNADDEAALLRARVRAGQLGPERLLLAAYLGHLPAQLACEEVPEAPDAAAVPAGDQAATDRFARLWSDGVVRYGGVPAAVRGVIGVVTAALEGHDPGPVARHHLDLAVAWLRTGAALQLRGCRKAVNEGAGSTPSYAEELTFLAVSACVDDEAGWLSRALTVLPVGTRVRWSRRPHDPSFVWARGAATAALLPWALGRSDPLAERVIEEERPAEQEVADLARRLETGELEPVRLRLAGALGHPAAAAALGTPVVLELEEIVDVVGAAPPELWARLFAAVIAALLGHPPVIEGSTWSVPCFSTEELAALEAAPGAEAMALLSLAPGEEATRFREFARAAQRERTAEFLLMRVQARVVPWALAP